MKVPNTNSNGTTKKASETRRDHSPNFKRETTLYFQIGLIICLLMSYFALEYAFTTEQTDLVKVTTTTDNYEITPEPYKVYVESQPIIKKPRQEQKSVEFSSNITEIDNESQESESNLIDTSLTDDKNKLNPNEVNVYNAPVDVTIPLNFVQKVPVFPGCEKAISNEESKKCFSEKIGKLIQKHFNTGIAQEYGLTGKQNIGVQFNVDTNGNVAEIKTRAPHPELEKEIKRVLNKIPKMQPGEQNNVPVKVQYALPINFVIHQ